MQKLNIQSKGISELNISSFVPVKEAVQNTVYIQQRNDDVLGQIAPDKTRHFYLHHGRDVPVGKEWNAADKKA